VESGEETIMEGESTSPGVPAAGAIDAPSLPAAVDRATFQAELDRLRVREKAHTREGDAIAAARRRLPMVEVDANLALIGPHGPLTQIGIMHLVCYLRDGDRVFETYSTTRRGVEAMDYSDALMDLAVYGRQEPWEDSPRGWPQPWTPDTYNWRINGDGSLPVGGKGRPIAQWSRLEAGRSDDLAVGH
jgi:predicted dithiol-disulfide oxidoreductase (DUF899 family)